MNGDRPASVSADAALERLDAIVDSTRKVELVYRELLEQRHAAAVLARQAGCSFGRIAKVLGVSRQTATEALRRAGE